MRRYLSIGCARNVSSMNRLQTSRWFNDGGVHENSPRKEILAIPTVIDNPQTVVNYLTTMKRDHQAHRFARIAGDAAHNTSTFLMMLSGTDTKSWLAPESALAVVSACVQLRGQDLVGALSFNQALIFLATDTPLSDGHQGMHGPRRLEEVCRVILALAGVSPLVQHLAAEAKVVANYLKNAAPVRLASALAQCVWVPDGDAMRSSEGTHTHQTLSTCTAVHASLAFAAIHKLCQLIGADNVHGHFRLSPLVGAQTLLAMLLSLDGSSLSRDQLSSSISNLIAEDTLGCFLKESSDAEISKVAFLVNRILCSIGDQDGKKFAQRHHLKSHNIVVLMSTMAKLCTAYNQQQVFKGRSSLLCRLSANLVSRTHQEPLFLSVGTAEFLLSKAEMYWKHFMRREVAVFVSSLAKLYQETILSRQSQTRPGPPQPTAITLPKSPRRFVKRSSVPSAAEDVEGNRSIVDDTPKSSVDHNSRVGWFFGETKDADDVEFESRLLAFVDNILSTLRLSIMGAEWFNVLKELSMLRQALTVFSLPCAQLDNVIVGVLERIHWGDSSVQQVSRAVAAVLNAPSPCIEHSASRLLHAVGHLIRKHIGETTPAHEIVELVHAAVCRGGLRRVHGLHQDTMLACLRAIHSSVITRGHPLDQANQVMLLTVLISYENGASCGASCPELDNVSSQLLGHFLPILVNAIAAQQVSSRAAFLMPSLSLAIATAKEKNGVSFHRIERFITAETIAITASLDDAATSAMLSWDLGWLCKWLMQIVSSRISSRELMEQRQSHIRWFCKFIIPNSDLEQQCKAGAHEGRWPAILLAIAIAGEVHVSEAPEGIAGFGGDSSDPLPAELWAAFQSSVRTFCQLVSVVQVGSMFAGDVFQFSESGHATTQTAAAMIARKIDQLFLRTGRMQDMLHVLHLLGMHEGMLISMHRTLERDLYQLPELAAKQAYLSSHSLLEAIADTHPNLRSKCLSAIVPLGCVAINGSLQLDEVFRVLLEFAPAVQPDALNQLVRSIPRGLTNHSNTAPTPETFLRLLQYFRVGRQPLSVRCLRGLFGTFLKSSLPYLLRVEDLLQIVDVPHSEREGSYWRICVLALLRRVRTDLGFSASKEKRDYQTILQPLTASHWTLVLTVPRVPPSAHISAQPSDAADDVKSSRGSSLGSLLLVLMLSSPPHRDYLLHLVGNKFTTAEATALMRDVIIHWDTISERPNFETMLLGNVPAMSDEQREIVGRWIDEWSPFEGITNTSDNESEQRGAAVNLSMFEGLIDTLYRRIFEARNVPREANGSVLAELLTWGPLEWGNVRTVDRVREFTQRLRAEASDTADISCIGLDELVGWCRRKASSIDEKIQWLIDGNEIVEGSSVCEERSSLLNIVEDALWLQWRSLSTGQPRSGGKSVALYNLTAAAACTLWLDSKWLIDQRRLSLIGDASSCSEQKHRNLALLCSWCQDLQRLLFDELLRLLQSANGSVMAQVVTALIPKDDGQIVVVAGEDDGSEAAVENVVRQILGRVSMLLGADMDNFSLHDVATVVPRLAHAGLLTDTTMSSMQRLCERALRARENGGELLGVEDEGARAWEPASRQPQSLAAAPMEKQTLFGVSVMLQANSKFAVKSPICEDDL